MLAVLALAVGLGACGGDKKQEQKAQAPRVAPTPSGEASISGTIALDPALKDKVGKAPLLMIISSGALPTLSFKAGSNAMVPEIEASPLGVGATLGACAFCSCFLSPPQAPSPTAKAKTASILKSLVYKRVGAFT